MTKPPTTRKTAARKAASIKPAVATDHDLARMLARVPQKSLKALGRKIDKLSVTPTAKAKPLPADPAFQARIDAIAARLREFTAATAKLEAEVVKAEAEVSRLRNLKRGLQALERSHGIR